MENNIINGKRYFNGECRPTYHNTIFIFFIFKLSNLIVHGTRKFN